MLVLPLLAVLLHPLFAILTKGFASDGQLVAGHQANLDEVVNDALDKQRPFCIYLLGMPPMLLTSSMTYFPLGLRSARTGVRSETF